MQSPFPERLCRHWGGGRYEEFLKVPLTRQTGLESFRMRLFYFMGNCPCLWKLSLAMLLNPLSMIAQRFPL
jgi:hypothetical protein